MISIYPYLSMSIHIYPIVNFSGTLWQAGPELRAMPARVASTMMCSMELRVAGLMGFIDINVVKMKRTWVKIWNQPL
jgi:hypothetical protein